MTSAAKKRRAADRSAAEQDRIKRIVWDPIDDKIKMEKTPEETQKEKRRAKKLRKLNP